MTSSVRRDAICSSGFRVDVYVDADFAGGWGFDCVRSRTGYIIEVMGCPVAWISKLQTDIATITMEAKYSALSLALRAAIPLLQVIVYSLKNLDSGSNFFAEFKVTAHEDNQDALCLGQLEPRRNTPHSKFYAIKHHWFRSWLKLKEIELIY